jgi:hypothetical protein
MLHGWDNASFAARPEYLYKAVDVIRTRRGPILECGSGLTTLIVTWLAQQSKTPIISLEHDSAWAETHGGRYGLLPVVRPFLAPGCLILLDDADREGEREALARWSSETGGTHSIEGGFAEFSLPS